MTFANIKIGGIYAYHGPSDTLRRVRIETKTQTVFRAGSNGTKRTISFRDTNTNEEFENIDADYLLDNWQKYEDLVAQQKAKVAAADDLAKRRVEICEAFAAKLEAAGFSPKRKKSYNSGKLDLTSYSSTLEIVVPDYPNK